MYLGARRTFEDHKRSGSIGACKPVKQGLRLAHLPEPCDTLWQEAMVGDTSACAELAWSTGEAMWTPITDDGRAVAKQPVELSQDDREDEMMVELHTDVGCIASAVAKIGDIWAVSIGCSTPFIQMHAECHARLPSCHAKQLPLSYPQSHQCAAG